MPLFATPLITKLARLKPHYGWLVATACLVVVFSFLSLQTSAQRRSPRTVRVENKTSRSLPVRNRKAPHPAKLTLQDGSLIGQPWTGDDPVNESNESIMLRGRERSASLQADEPRPLKKEHESPDRDRLPQNPEAIPGSSWPSEENGIQTERLRDRETERPVTNQSDKRPLRSRVSPSLPLSLSPSLLAPQPVTFSFTAATQTDSGSYPPDSMGAAGPTQFLMAINGRIRVFDKNTGQVGALDADLDTFFTSVRDSAFTTDPRVRFDRLSNRWIVTAINYLRSGQLVLNNKILIAVSDGPQITATTFWRFYSFQHNTVTPVGTAGLFADYPTLSVDANALYIGVNLFYANDTFGGCDLFVIRKSSIVSGGTIVVTAFRGLTTGPNQPGMFTPQGADSADAASANGYVIATDNASLGKLVFRRVSDPGGTPVLSPNYNLNVLATGLPLKVPHLGNLNGTDGQLDSVGDRLFSAHVRNGRLWTAHNIGVDNRGSSLNLRTRNAARWYEIGDLNTDAPRLMQAGTLFADSTTNTVTARHYFIPSLMVSGQGHVAMGFSTAGSNEYINAGTAGRLATDTPGTMRTPLQITNANQPYNPSRDPGDSVIGRRWGDYSYTSLDPCDDMTMWTVQQFADGLNSYSVKVAKLQAPLPATPASVNTPSVAAGQANVEITVYGLATSGAGFYDPGESFACRLSAQINGGVSVQRVTYVNPTTLRLTISTVGATAGTKNISVTNPDGQSVTGNNLITVGDCSFSVAPTTANVPANGNGGTLNVTSTCAWTAISQSSFITITAGASGSGNGTVSYQIAPNINAAPRTGTLIVAGQTVTITQAAGAGCTYELAPVTQNFLSYGGLGTVTINAANECAWNAAPSDNFVSVLPGYTGFGSSTVTFSVAANTSAQSRVATLTIGNRNVIITQEAAPRELAIDDGSFERDSGNTIGGTIYRLNRLTPTSYPATLNSVAIYFSGRGGARAGLEFTLMAGNNADGDNVIDGTVFQNLTQTISAINEFSVYNLTTPLTINSGDFVIGFRMVTTPEIIPLGFDNTSAARRRSYRSDDGVAFILSEGLNGSAVNYGIRGRLAGTTQEVIGFESDIAPRPSGNDFVSASDWTLMGRFVAGLLTPALGSEYQRADCAPRETGGDGRLSAADFTQAGRYAAGLDDPVRASGPVAPLFVFADASSLLAQALRVNENRKLLPFTEGKTQTVTLSLDANGRENALSGTLRFNQQDWRLVNARAAYTGANAVLNDTQRAQGRVGFMLALPTEQTFPKGSHKVFTLTFVPRTAKPLQLWFDDSILHREFADQRARTIVTGEQFNLYVK